MNSLITTVTTYMSDIATIQQEVARLMAAAGQAVTRETLLNALLEVDELYARAEERTDQLVADTAELVAGYPEAQRTVSATAEQQRAYLHRERAAMQAQMTRLVRNA